MDLDILSNISNAITKIPILPYLWVPHCIVMCQAVKATLGDKNAQIYVSNPLSLYLMSMIYTYPGGILSQFVLGQPLLGFLTNTQQLTSFSLVWYLMFYTRISNIFTHRLVLPCFVLAQDLMRLNLVSTGVKTILVDYPDAFLYPVVFATIKSSGFMIVKYVEHTLVNGLSKPFTVPHHSAKTMFLAACVLTAHHQGFMSGASQESLFVSLVLLTFSFRIFTTNFEVFKGTDPYLIFENPLCSNVFGVIGNVDINKNVEEKKKK